MFSTKFDERNKLWGGANVPPLFHPKLSLGHAILWRLKKNPNKVSQISVNSGIELTNGDLYIKTVRAAQNLQKLGFKKNDVFGLVAKNSHHVAPIIFASLCMGCPINTLDSGFNKPEMIHMLSTSKPKLVFCDVDVFELVSNCLKELQNDAKIYTFGGTLGHSMVVEDLFAETHNEWDYIATEVDGENQIGIIVCSSGTTGLSKGVCLSHAVLLDQMSGIFPFREDDIVLCFSSLYWLSGVVMLLSGPLLGTTRVITTESFSPERLLSITEKYKVTYIFGAVHHLVLTTKCKEIATTDLSSVRHYLCGGSKAPLEIIKKVNEYLPNGEVNIGYGLSELGGVISVDIPFSGRDTVGKLFAGSQVKIIDDNGNRCGINENGEICIKQLYKSLGYYGNEEATKQLIDDEGFIRTADIGYFDEDGYLYIVDRKKDLLKYCSFQISPAELESYLIKFNGIKTVCIVGVNDQTSGDLPAAVIVKNDREDITKEEIDKQVSENFADCKRLRGGIYFVDSLPTTPSGKVIRRKVKELAEELYKKQHN